MTDPYTIAAAPSCQSVLTFAAPAAVPEKVWTVYQSHRILVSIFSSFEVVKCYCVRARSYAKSGD